jgi:hypothetical protein
MSNGCNAAGAVTAVRLAEFRGARHVPDLATNVLLSVAAFAGAFVSSLAGFAFSAVAGAILLRVFQPMEAVPLLLERQSLSPKLVIDLAVSLPALLAGSVLGIVSSRNINEVGFRRTILVLLLISGTSLALA